jgi:hypothetical protein
VNRPHVMGSCAPLADHQALMRPRARRPRTMCALNEGFLELDRPAPDAMRPSD